jgi:hypothetical protein
MMNTEIGGHQVKKKNKVSLQGEIKNGKRTTKMGSR